MSATTTDAGDVAGRFRLATTYRAQRVEAEAAFEAARNSGPAWYVENLAGTAAGFRRAVPVQLRYALDGLAELCSDAAASESGRPAELLRDAAAAAHRDAESGVLAFAPAAIRRLESVWADHPGGVPDWVVELRQALS